MPGCAVFVCSQCQRAYMHYIHVVTIVVVGGSGGGGLTVGVVDDGGGGGWVATVVGRRDRRVGVALTVVAIDCCVDGGGRCHHCHRHLVAIRVGITCGATFVCCGVQIPLLDGLGFWDGMIVAKNSIG